MELQEVIIYPGFMNKTINAFCFVLLLYLS